jgi:pentatricopeptide repeat protein
MDDAQEVFDGISFPNSFSWSILIRGYAQNDRLIDAKHALYSNSNADTISWNTMISAYAQKQEGIQALDMFWEMQTKGIEPDMVTFLCVFEACSSLVTLDEASEFLIHFHKSKYYEDVTLRTALINLYGKFGRIDDARITFDEMASCDVVSWNAMIGAYAQNGHDKKALDLFHKMNARSISPTHITFVSALDACASLLDLEEGFQFHANCIFLAYEGDTSVGNALVNMYANCGCLEEAIDSFDRIHRCSVVSWTALMKAYSCNEQAEQALLIFWKMHLDGISPNKVTFICALDACSSMVSLENGLKVHVMAVNHACENDVLLATALIDMYGKCGLAEDALNVFRQMGKQDITSWNAMLTACAKNGHGILTHMLFDQMLKDGFTPNTVSFICVLTVCSHMGWVNGGQRHFMAMYKEFNMRPAPEHFACMIDVLGRAGRLEEAEDLVDTMPVVALLSSWTSLLAACRIHGDVHRGSRIANYFGEFNAMDPVSYLLLSDIYAAEGG